jgi:hypothetical protein
MDKFHSSMIEDEAQASDTPQYFHQVIEISRRLISGGNGFFAGFRLFALGIPLTDGGF